MLLNLFYDWTPLLGILTKIIDPLGAKPLFFTYLEKTKFVSELIIQVPNF